MPSAEPVVGGHVAVAMGGIIESPHFPYNHSNVGQKWRRRDTPSGRAKFPYAVAPVGRLEFVGVLRYSRSIGFRRVPVLFSEDAHVTIGLCILGCGSFAAAFARSITDLRDDIGLYFASRDLLKARDYASRFHGLDAFGDYATAVADARVDAVYVCTPHHLHREHTRLAVNAGKHVLVEKPIAGSPVDAEAIVQISDTAGVNIMVAENYRFVPAVVESKRLIDEGRLGQVRLVQLHEQYPFRTSGWRSSAEQNGGGVLIDGGIHKLSGLSYLAGYPNRVYAQEVLPGQRDLEAEDGVAIITHSPNGVTGLINHSWNVAPPKPHSWVSISGSLASLYFEAGQPWLRVTDADSETVVDLEPHSNGLAPMVKEFHRSILEGREPPMTARDGMADLSLVLAAHESMASGLPCSLS